MFRTTEHPGVVARVGVVAVAWGLALAGQILAAQADEVQAVSPGTTIAFVNVHTIPMTDDRVHPEQVVLVRRDRIVAAGSRHQIPVPQGSVVIDGRGRYLVPGLTDAHVHLDGDGTRRGTSRSGFGDGPLYLAHGVTTVFNERGLPIHLEWRDQVKAGALVGPTIYTAGEFVNEPRVHTPEDVEREIRAQKAAGYDFIKFHEVYTRETGFLTTEGLLPETYARMNEVARELNMPLVGHAPVNLGLDPLLSEGQTLAHVGALSHVYFLPMFGNVAWLALTAVSLAALTIIAITNGLRAIVNRGKVTGRLPRSVSRVRELAGMQLLAAAVAGASAILFLPGGPWFESGTLRIVFTVTIVLLAIATVAIVFTTVRIWSEPETSTPARVQAAIASVAGIGLAWATLAFWVPVVWRSSEGGIEHVATRVAEAGISVQTTLVAYDAIGGPGRRLLVTDPAIEYLHPDVQRRWRRLRAAAPRLRYTDFMKTVTGALHRAGVPLIAGTDAMGYPLVTPGSSLHRELELLVESGLTPYDALYAATVAPARFIHQTLEFGRIVAGRRADLLLVEGNPIEDISHLRNPVGVMARGRWYTRDELQAMLKELVADD